MHHCMVQVGVKGFARGTVSGDAQLLQGGSQTVKGHLHALLQALKVLLGGAQRPLQIVKHREKCLHGLAGGVGVSVALFFIAALAEVGVFRRQPQQLIFCVCQLLFQRRRRVVCLGLVVFFRLWRCGFGFCFGSGSLGVWLFLCLLLFSHWLYLLQQEDLWFYS